MWEWILRHTFALGTDLDLAQVLVQNRVAIAEPKLPEDVRRGGITTTKQSPDILLVAHVLSPDESLNQLFMVTSPVKLEPFLSLPSRLACPLVP